MKYSPRFRRNKRYINPSSRRSENAFKLQAYLYAVNEK